MARTLCRLVILFGAAFIAMLVGVAARATEDSSQSEPAPAAISPQPSPSSSGLEQVVVTATRREESVQNVPISMSALSQKAIEDLHVQNFNDLESVVPGLVFSTPTFSQPNGQNDIAIRGIFSGGTDFAPTVQVYIDETPIEEHIVGVAGVYANFSPDMFDLDRVEVLRGPQGTLFGSSAMGGAVRFITPQPGLTEVSGYATGEMSYSPDGAPSYNLGLAYGAPIVDGVAGFRISAYYHDLGGYINQEDPYTGQLLSQNINSQTDYVLRPALTIAPLKGLTITLSEFLENNYVANPAAYWLTDLPVPRPGGQPATGSTQQEPTYDSLSVPALDIKYELSALTIESNTSYLHRSYANYSDFTRADTYFVTGKDFVPGVPQGYSQFWDDFALTNTVQQELRFTSNDEPGTRFHWIGGLYYRDSNQRATQLLPGTLDPILEAAYGETTQQFFGFGNYVDNTGQVYNGYIVFTNKDTEEAFFGELAYDFTSRLKVSVGTRVSHDSVSSHQIIAGPLNFINYSNTYLPSETQNPVTPRASITYKVADQSMVYTTVAKGYRLGGDQVDTWAADPLCQPSLKLLPGVVPSNTYRSDSLWSYELGAKSTLLNDRLQVNASVYYIDWSNIQTSIPVPACLESFIANFGKATSKGFDLDVRVALTEGLTVGVTGGYTDAYYPNSEILGTALLAQAGERLPNVPPWSVAANLVYRRALPFLSDSNGYFRIDFRHISAFPQLDPLLSTTDPALESHQDPGYSTLNLRLGVVHGVLDTSVFVDNATNDNPLVGYYHYGPGDQLFQAWRTRPLTMGITAKYAF
jgi:iron complex outermembrane recepter protein